MHVRARMGAGLRNGKRALTWRSLRGASGPAPASTQQRTCCAADLARPCTPSPGNSVPNTSRPPSAPLPPPQPHLPAGSGRKLAGPAVILLRVGGLRLEPRNVISVLSVMGPVSGETSEMSGSANPRKGRGSWIPTSGSCWKRCCPPSRVT